MMGPALSFIKMLGGGRIGVQDGGRLSTLEIPVKRKVPNLDVHLILSAHSFLHRWLLEYSVAQRSDFVL
jgi:hypothetical protein